MTQNSTKLINGLELTSVVSALREQLAQAVEQAQGEQVQFQLNTIDVELQTVIDTAGSSTASGKINFWVLDMDASLGGKYKRSATHKIRLNLSPIDTAKESEAAAKEAEDDGAVRISGNVKRVS